MRDEAEHKGDSEAVDLGGRRCREAEGLKLLLIGGPKFVGHALIEAALARGHEVTTFNRGQTNPDAFPEVEKLHGDRETDVSALEGRTWDGVLDTSGYLPHAVRNTVEAVTASRYCFVSSISYYADYREPRVESDPAEQLQEGHPADRLLEDYANYGALKALCEQEVVRGFGDRAAPRPARPDRRPERPDRPLHVLAPPRPSAAARSSRPPAEQPVQMIDVRDLAEWMLRLVEDGAQRRRSTRPRRRARTRSARCWTPAAPATSSGWTRVPRRAGGRELERPARAGSRRPIDDAAFQLVDVSRALAAGLAFRPLAETARDVPEWTGKAGLTPEREAELLEAWKAAV